MFWWSEEEVVNELITYEFVAVDPFLPNSRTTIQQGFVGERRFSENHGPYRSRKDAKKRMEIHEKWNIGVRLMIIVTNVHTFIYLIIYL